MIESSERLATTPGREALAATLAKDAPKMDAFSIVRLQGLELHARKIPMTLLIIDHLETAPAEN
jgi:uncharacterized protein (TIGR03435 family)